MREAFSFLIQKETPETNERIIADISKFYGIGFKRETFKHLSCLLNKNKYDTMEQMNVDDVFKITIDFEAENLPKTVKVFQPILFNEGEGFRCVLGPDLQKGIVGYGDSLDEALLDWDKSLKERIKSKSVNDEVAQYVIDTLNTSVNDVW